MNIDLIKGGDFQFLPQYFNIHPDTYIALLHLNLDVYERSIYVLEKCFDRILPGGLVVVDDHAAVRRATRAVNEFIQAR